jgi:tetratricopeptide (TPR) repeat protein
MSMKIWEVVRKHAPRVIVTVVVAVLIVVGVWTWSHFADARASKSTGVLSRAFEIYNQTVFPMETKLPPSEDGIPRFKTHKAKLEASEKEFTKAIESSSGSLKAIAVLMRAGVRFELGLFDKALEDYREYEKTGQQEDLKFNAMEGIGYCHEGKKEWDKALAAFRGLPRDGERKWLATYHEGRILAKKGNKKEAMELLKKVVEKATSKLLQDRASDQLALIEKGGAAAAAPTPNKPSGEGAAASSMPTKQDK